MASIVHTERCESLASLVADAREVRCWCRRVVIAEDWMRCSGHIEILESCTRISRFILFVFRIQTHS